MPATIEFFDMAVTVTPPQGHFEPFPLVLGASWQPNDVRFLFVSASGQSSSTDLTTLMMPMYPDPPTGFTSAYSLDPTLETKAVFYQRLAPSSTDTAVWWPKPPSWRHFLWATLTARGVDPSVAPVAGKLSLSHTVEDGAIVAGSVSVPAAGTMVFAITTFADLSGRWPSWPGSMGVPTGWTPMVATDKSGINYFPYDSNPGLIVIGKSYSGSGSTGSVSIPFKSGSPSMTGMYFFVQSALDVSITVGSA